MEHQRYSHSRSEQHFDQNPLKKRRSFGRKKPCRFCGDKELKADYKDPKLLATFISERGRITPRRITGSCAYHQRQLNTEIKRARIMALLPFTATHR